MKVHKFIPEYPYVHFCDTETYETGVLDNDRCCSKSWKKVTCKRCLRKRNGAVK